MAEIVISGRNAVAGATPEEVAATPVREKTVKPPQ